MTGRTRNDRHPLTRPAQDSRAMRVGGVRLRAVVAVALTILAVGAVGTAPASASTPSAKTATAPGPRLAVADSTLAKALKCSVPPGGGKPILLVHGTSTTPDISWADGLERLLKSSNTVCTVELPDKALGDINAAGQYVVASIRAMAEQFDQPVSVIGHSQGGMVLRWALKWWPDLRSLVGDVIGLSPSNHGAPLGNLLCTAVCAAAAWQQSPSSPFLKALNSGDETPGDVSYSVIYSDTDSTVPPPSPAIAGDADDSNTRVQAICAGRQVSHTQMQYDAVALALVRDALAHKGPARASRISANLCREKYAQGIDSAAAEGRQLEGALFSVRAIATARQLPAEPALPSFAVQAAPRPHAQLKVRQYKTKSGLRLRLRATGTDGTDRWPLPFATFTVAGKHVKADADGRANVRLGLGLGLGKTRFKIRLQTPGLTRVVYKSR